MQLQASSVSEDNTGPMKDRSIPLYDGLDPRDIRPSNKVPSSIATYAAAPLVIFRWLPLAEKLISGRGSEAERHWPNYPEGRICHTEIQSCLVSLLQDLQMILDTVQWASLLHRIIPSCWFGQTSLAITWSVVGCRLLTVLKAIFSHGSSQHHHLEPAIITRFFQNIRFLDYHLLLWRPNLSVSPSSGRRHRPRLPETSISP